MIISVLLALVSLAACGDDPRTSGGDMDEADDLPELVGESVAGPESMRTRCWTEHWS